MPQPETPVAAAAPAAATPAPEATKAEVKPEKPLSPVERAAQAWDKIHEAAKVRAAQAPKETPADAPVTDATKADGEESAQRADAKEGAEEPLSTKFAAVAKLERQARETLKAARAREEALTKREAELNAKAAALEEKRRKAKLSPSEWLAEGGLSYDDVTLAQLNGGKPTPELQASAALAEVEALRKEHAEAARKSVELEQQRAKAEHDARYSAWTQGVIDYVKANAAEYELINQQGAHELVPATIQAHFEKTQRVLSEPEAATLVEKHLEQQAEKLLQSKKLQARFKPPEQAESAQPRPTATPTLHNGLTASTSLGGRPKTAAERKEAALLAMNKAGASK